MELGRYLQVHSARVMGWIEGRRLPPRREAQLRWLTKYVDALERSFRDVPPCEHHFEPMHGGVIVIVADELAYRPDLYHALDEMIEFNCPVCEERNTVFDGWLSPSDSMPRALPFPRFWGQVVGGFAMALASAPLIRSLDVPTAWILGAILVGAISGDRVMRWYYQVGQAL